MSKLVRNSIFTLIILILTALGLGWNKSIVRRGDPVQISSAVLSAQSVETHSPFSLAVKFAEPRLKLGQYQEMEISTVVGASLEIVTVYPNGSIDNPQTLRAVADETGQYKLRFKLDDFAFLGVFEARVIARSNGQVARASTRFALQTWAPAETALDKDGYVYPLVP